MTFWRWFSSKTNKELFLEFSPQDGDYYSVSWNFDLAEPSHRQWVIEILGKEKIGIQWVKKAKESLRFFRNDKVIGEGQLNSGRAEASSLMNLALHATLKNALEVHQQFMLAPVSGATTDDFQSEARALQWIQASFGTLSRVLKKFSEDPSLIFTAACFSGTVPETGEKVIRLIAFNLDVLYYLREDHSLQIVVFDDKNMGHGKSKAPTFQQTIKVTKPQFYDEIVKLTHQLAQVGELR